MQRLMYSNQQSLFDPIVHSVTGSPTTTSHCLARVTAVLKSCNKQYLMLLEGITTTKFHLGICQETSFLFRTEFSGRSSHSGDHESPKLLSLDILHPVHLHLSGQDYDPVARATIK